MSKSNERCVADMDFVLEETCRVFPHGGDHERRKFIAEKLRRQAIEGDTTLKSFWIVAHRALNELNQRSS